MAASNFLQWNPTAANQETDSAYSADALRSGGAANPAVFPSATANKLFFQLSTFVTALAQALATKGYAMSDASLSTLTANLANVITTADLAPYAPIANPSFTGSPAAPTAATADNSTKLATTAFVKAQGYAPVASPGFSGNPTGPTPAYTDNSSSLATTNFVKGQGFQNALGFTPVQQGGGTGQGTNKVYIGYDNAQGGVLIQIDNNNTFGHLVTTSNMTASIGTSGYQRFPSGLMMQWGYVVLSVGSGVVTFPLAFPSNCISAQVSLASGSTQYSQSQWTATPVLNGFSASTMIVGMSGAAGSSFGVYWFAIGY